MFGGRAGWHEIFEAKVYNSIVARPGEATPRSYGGVRGDRVLSPPRDSLGDRAGTAAKPLPAKRGGGARKAKYQHALDAGHTITPLICEVWGGFAPEAIICLRRLAESRAGKLTSEAAWSTWATRGFMSYHAQRLSLELHIGVAREIWRAATGGSAAGG